MVFQIPNSYVGEPDPGQPSSVVLTQILQTEISGNGAQESVLFKELPRRLDVWPGLETTGSARLKCWAINAIPMSYHNRKSTDQYLPWFVFLINTKQLDTKSRGGSHVDGMEVLDLLRQ